MELPRRWAIAGPKMVFSPLPLPAMAGKMVVWTNQHPEPGFAILTDGSVAGFGFDGHFLSAAAAKPIVDQSYSLHR